MFGDFLGSCENYCFSRQTGEATFGQLLEKLGQLLISASGHTVQGYTNAQVKKNVQSLHLRRPSLRKDRERAFEIARKKLN